MFELMKLALAGLISLGVSWCFWKIRTRADARIRAWEESLRAFEDYIDLLHTDLAVFRGVKEGQFDWALFLALRQFSPRRVGREPSLVDFKRLEGTKLLRLHDALVTLLQKHGLAKREEISTEQIMEIPAEVFDKAEELLDQMAVQVNELRKRGPSR